MKKRGSICFLVLILILLLSGCVWGKKVTPPEADLLNCKANYVVAQEGVCEWKKAEDKTSKLVLYKKDKEILLAEMDVAPGQMLSDGRNLYLCGAENVHQYDPKTGKVTVLFEVEAPVLWKYMLVGDELCFVDERAIFVRYHLTDGTKTEYPLSDIEIVDMKAFGFGYADGYLYYNRRTQEISRFVSENLNTGEVLELARVYGAHNIYRHENGNLYFASVNVLTNQNALCYLDQSGVVHTLAEGVGFRIDYHFRNEWIYYSSGYSSLYRVRLDGTQMEKVLEGAGYPKLFQKRLYLQTLSQVDGEMQTVLYELNEETMELSKIPWGTKPTNQ